MISSGCAFKSKAFYGSETPMTDVKCRAECCRATALHYRGMLLIIHAQPLI